MTITIAPNPAKSRSEGYEHTKTQASLIPMEKSAERVGFEPTDAVTRRQFSRLVP